MCQCSSLGIRRKISYLDRSHSSGFTRQWMNKNVTVHEAYTQSKTKFNVIQFSFCVYFPQSLSYIFWLCFGLFVQPFTWFSIESMKSIRYWNLRKMNVHNPVHFRSWTRILLISCVCIFYRILLKFSITLYNLSEILKTQHFLCGYFCRNLLNLCKMKVIVSAYISLLQKYKIILPAAI